jgi:hypothetical protein
VVNISHSFQFFNPRGERPEKIASNFLIPEHVLWAEFSVLCFGPHAYNYLYWSSKDNRYKII